MYLTYVGGPSANRRAKSTKRDAPTPHTATHTTHRPQQENFRSENMNMKTWKLIHAFWYMHSDSWNQIHTIIRVAQFVD